MPARSLSLLGAVIWLLTGCGQSTAGWHAVAPTAAAGGVEVRLVSTEIDDQLQPWRSPPGGDDCLVMRVEIRSLDGRAHELRPEQFRLDGTTPLDAIGYCNAPQLEPTWARPAGGTLQITFLTATGTEPHLQWRPD